MKKTFIALLALALLFGMCMAIAIENLPPAWAADPLKYNSCTDYYRAKDTTALLIDNRVYYPFMAFEHGTLIMTVEPGKPETTRVLRDLSSTDYIFCILGNLFDTGTGLLLIEVTSGIVYRLSYDGSSLDPFFTLEDPNPCFSILVGQTLYCNQENQIVSFDLHSGEKQLIYELPIAAKNLDRFSWNAEYAKGYLLIKVAKVGFFSINVQSGAVYRLDDILSIDSGVGRAMLVLNDRVYANGNARNSYGLYSVDFHDLNPIRVCEEGMMSFRHASANAVLLRDDYIGNGTPIDLIFFNPDASIAEFYPDHMTCIVSPTTNKSSFMLGNRLYFSNYADDAYRITVEGLLYKLSCYDSILIDDLLEQSIHISYSDLLSAAKAGNFAQIFDLLGQFRYDLVNLPSDP